MSLGASILKDECLFCSHVNNHHFKMEKKHILIIIIITKTIANILIIIILILFILIHIICSDVDCNHCKLEKLEQPRGEVIFYNGLNKEEVDFLCSGFSLFVGCFKIISSGLWRKSLVCQSSMTWNSSEILKTDVESDWRT